MDEVSFLPNGQSTLTFAFVDFGCDNVTSESKVSNFACLVVRYEDVTCSQVTMNDLLMEIRINVGLELEETDTYPTRR